MKVHVLYGRELFVLFFVWGVWRCLVDGKVTNSSAQFFIRMKKLLVTLVALVCAVVGYAQQSTMVATLTHGETITSYYGTFAFQKAVEVAVSGDVITLSSGGFQAADISNNITVRGAGINCDYPTIIIGDFSTPVQTEEGALLSFEGIKFTGKILTGSNYERKINFNKCEISYIDTGSGNTPCLESSFSNCITHAIWCRDKDKINIINCICYDAYWEGASLLNCVISDGDGSLELASYTNCIIINRGNDRLRTDERTVFRNCITIGNGDPFTVASGNCTSGVEMDIFSDQDDISKDLTDTAKETYLGDDNTPVGIYGGFLPWSTTPSYPQISKLDISNRTTSDGQLNVEVEVNSVQQQ